MPEPEATQARRFDWRLARELPAVRVSLVVSVALGLLSTAAIVAQAVALAHLLASAMPGASPVGRAQWYVLLGTGFGVRALSGLAGEIVAEVGSSQAKADIRYRLVMAALEGAPAAQGEGATWASADIATLAGRGLDALDAYISRCLPDFVLAVAAPLALLFTVGTLDWVSALVMAIAVVLFPVFGNLVGRATMTLAVQRWEQVQRLGRQVADVFQGLPVLRAFGRSASQREAIAKVSAALSRSSSRALRVAFLSGLVLDTLGSVAVALVAVPLGLRLLDGSVSLPAALAVLVVAPEVFLPMRRASAQFHESTEGLAAAGQAMALIGTSASTPSEEAGAKRHLEASLHRPVPDPRSSDVALRKVSVVLPGHPGPLLEHVDLTVRPGEKVVLLGPSGSGKSTVLLVLLGFVAPSSGAVLIGGEDLAQLDRAAWRRRLAYLPEQPALLAASLADNLRLANPEASDAQLIEALARVGASHLLDAWPDGLQERLGDGGRKVSAGELQRIALARVTLRPASLYLLDEPTVHLDSDAEEKALEGLGTALEGASALVVSHRPAVARLADRVVAVEAGRLAELVTAGRHALASWGPALPPARQRPARA
ncbi:MAG: thiol reductant ABC exporter subunit CydD [Acidimicrobiales bacterium]